MSRFFGHDWTFLAQMLRKADDRLAYATDRQILRTVVESIADDLEQDNKNFDRKLFLDNIYLPQPPTIRDVQNGRP